MSDPGRSQIRCKRLDNLIGAPTGLAETSPHLACDDVELIKYVSWLREITDRCDPRPAER